MIALKEWKDIADDFQDTLLLGNGASIALDSCFTYRSLFGTAKKDGLITADVQAVFDYFGTTDFEHVLRMLWHTLNVNRSLSISEARTAQAYVDLRSALIQTVRKSHVDFQSIQHHLDPIQKFMGRFSKVLSLNYDLTVYWAMLEGNESRGGNWFKDCWLAGGYEGDWEWLATPYQVSGATLVFYPHGSLLFATHPRDGEIKISIGASAHNLLERIVSVWADENALPMFVSEGETQQKVAAVARHGYLTSVYNDVMTEMGPSVAIYGWGMGENDDHILKRVASRRISRIAISVYRGSQSPQEIDKHCTKLLWRIQHYNSAARVEFFDSTSPGCWSNR
jgi:hypothetical protein